MRSSSTPTRQRSFARAFSAATYTHKHMDNGLKKNNTHNKTFNPLLNRVECTDESLHTQWYWKNVAHGIAKWHLSLVNALGEKSEVFNK